jgi:hypothetical protein
LSHSASPLLPFVSLYQCSPSGGVLCAYVPLVL